ncbi:MAG: hypothetical protein ABI725_07800 [Chloroflexota bacterium]
MLRIPGSIIYAIIVGGGAVIRGIMESRERRQQKAAADVTRVLEPTPTLTNEELEAVKRAAEHVK